MPQKPKLNPQEQKQEDEYLNKIFQHLYPNLKVCPQCQKKTKFHKLKNYKTYICQRCGYHINPLANTIFHKSSTPLNKWFKAFSIYKKTYGNISVRQFAKETGLTIGTAWRIKKQIEIFLFRKTDSLYEYLKNYLL